MGEFFKPWRRKVGVFTLLLACAFAGGWVRSLSVCDSVNVYRTNALFIFISSGGSLGWFDHHQGIDTSRLKTMPFPYWGMRPLADFPDRFESREITWQIRYFGFGIGNCSDRVSVLRVPYWSIVFPLTPLSAYLLRSKGLTFRRQLTVATGFSAEVTCQFGASQMK